ncbi:hypothetical protein GCK32_021404 [Trichostrongylus colubriformis]|uniref:Uncharacterized protein n=1 Tax=Trichostrongylus colubriformis TaxID=6319 RepID=A0AAN8FJ91_TRICO
MPVASHAPPTSQKQLAFRFLHRSQEASAFLMFARRKGKQRDKRTTKIDIGSQNALQKPVSDLSMCWVLA